MRVIVLGSGVIGVASAYYLAQQGASVTVLDRQAGPAEETSFGNAGQISPGYSTPWAAPGIPFKAVKWMFQHHAPLAINIDGSMWQLNWMAQMLKNCNPQSYAINKERMTRVAEYSRDCLRELRKETGIHYENRAKGTLQVFRNEAQLDAVQRDIQVLKECGVDYELLLKDDLAKVEPALAYAKDKLVGGLHLPNDETDPAFAPQSTVLDETYKIAITRFDQRIRVGGMAELSGFNHGLNQDRRATLEMVTQDLFPGGNLAEASFWTGLRPMTPDSTPIIGATRFKNLFLNTGHGTLGWTMACGSGKLISDLVMNHQPDISTEGLSIQRYPSAA
ncbi:hypothetical protein LTR94_020957 [Friedmanniomyces endolithicus]|nr:hypothetical protein LTR94_020957 [Friedmanniomyces endolithicus]